ncbi:MAG: cytochrome c-type biogenesis CcmF C-terminal domain-containing protein, partial [Gemmatimonadota bacterium]
LVAYILAGFVLGTVTQEFARGIRARMRMYQESLPLALANLVNRNRRRYGGYIVHVAILLYFVGWAGMAFRVTREATLAPGESVTMRSPYGHDWTFTFLGISQYTALNRQVSAATLEIAKDGTKVGVIKSEKRQHVDSFGNKTFEPSTEVGIQSDLREDLYLVYAGSIAGTERSNFAITINPLVWWVWAGGALLVFGGFITMWPGGRPTGTLRREAQPGFEAELVGTGSV